MSRISKPSCRALVVVLAQSSSCRARTGQQSEAQGRGAGPIDEAFRPAGDPGGDHGSEGQRPELEGATHAVGSSRSGGDLDERRHAWHPDLRPAAQGERESLTPEEFARRAGGDEASRDRAVNQETILRNEFGVRTFGYTSFIVDPPNGQMPALTQAAHGAAKGDQRTRARSAEGRGTTSTTSRSTIAASRAAFPAR